MKIVNVMLLKVHGGIGQVYIDYCEMLLGLGHEVYAICHANSIWVEKTKDLQSSNPKLKILEVSSKGGPFAIITMLKIAFLCKKMSPDAIIIHNYINMCLWATRWSKAPKIGVSHMYKYKHVNRLDGFITLTSEIHEKVITQGVNSAKLAIIPNAIGLDSVKPKFSQHSPPVIGAIGRLAHEKGFHILIKSLSILKKRNIRFKCLIGGDGPQKEELLQLAKKNNALDCLEFLGEIVDNKNFYKKVDFLALPSLSETFGLTILEAAKFGKPIIASKMGGPKEILTDYQDTLFFEPGDYEMLAEKLILLFENKALCEKLVTSCYRLVSEKYSYSIVGKELERFIKSLA
jgi:glycosyltransferase involved in cell wall biosynthesis